MFTVNANVVPTNDCYLGMSNCWKLSQVMSTQYLTIPLLDITAIKLMIQCLFVTLLIFALGRMFLGHMSPSLSFTETYCYGLESVVVRRLSFVVCLYHLLRNYWPYLYQILGLKYQPVTIS